MPTIVAAWERMRNGKEPVAPLSEGDHATNFLYMLTGKMPDPYNAHVLDVALVLHADHELNASTFAARVTAATLSDMYSSTTSPIPPPPSQLHGSAPHTHTPM